MCIDTFKQIGASVKDLDNNIVYFGNNLKKMREHFPDESVKLIYTDPPFGSNRNYERIWGDENEIRTFSDRWKGGIDHYISWMVPRLEEMYRILSNDGSFYLHCDNSASHRLKIKLDEIFKSPGGFKSDIIWKRCHPKGNSKTYANNSDNILFYTKSDNFTFNTQYTSYSEKTLKLYTHDDIEKGKFRLGPLNAPGGNGYKYDLGFGEKCPDSGYRWSKETMIKKIKEGDVYIKPGKVPCQIRFLSDNKGVPLDNIWLDIENVQNPSYPTQKPIELIKRIVKISSDEGDIVFDPFVGGGTTIMASYELNRNFIGIEVSDTACRKIEKLGVPVAWQQNWGNYSKMKPHEFQNWVCEKMRAKNTSRNVFTASGPDKGIDGKVRTDPNTIGFQGCPLQIKQEKKVNYEEVIKLQERCRWLNRKNGFLIALSFTPTAWDQRAKFLNDGICNITLITGEELQKVDYYNYEEIKKGV